MYLNFFHFQEEPFNITPDPRFLYLSRQHEEAIESLLYGVEHRKGFMAVIGDIGTGKTTLSRAVINRLGDSIDTSVILNPMLSVHELLQAINDDFGNRVESKTVKGELDALNTFLLKRRQKGGNAVVLIDEAQHLSVEALEMTRMLSNLETEENKLLQIIFLGQRELEEKLRSPELRQVNQRIGIRYLLGALDYGETCHYIFHRISVVGGEGSVQFDERALRRIFLHSRGVPRLINTICDRALLEAYAERKRLVTKKMVVRATADIDGTLNVSGRKVLEVRRNFWRFLFGA